MLLDLCLGKRFPVIVRSGYGLSALAVLAHVVEWFGSRADFHRLGLTVITIGFGLLSVVSVIAVLWSGEENPRSLSMRLLSAMSLFLLAISFVHFNHSKSSDAWSTELAVHHAGIPLALFIIMQDYRFVFLGRLRALSCKRFTGRNLRSVHCVLFAASRLSDAGYLPGDGPYWFCCHARILAADADKTGLPATRHRASPARTARSGSAGDR